MEIPALESHEDIDEENESGENQITKRLRNVETSSFDQTSGWGTPNFSPQTSGWNAHSSPQDLNNSFNYNQAIIPGRSPHQTSFPPLNVMNIPQPNLLSSFTLEAVSTLRAIAIAKTEANQFFGESITTGMIAEEVRKIKHEASKRASGFDTQTSEYILTEEELDLRDSLHYLVFNTTQDNMGLGDLIEIIEKNIGRMPKYHDEVSQKFNSMDVIAVALIEKKDYDDITNLTEEKLWLPYSPPREISLSVLEKAWRVTLSGANLNTDTERVKTVIKNKINADPIAVKFFRQRNNAPTNFVNLTVFLKSEQDYDAILSCSSISSYYA